MFKLKNVSSSILIILICILLLCSCSTPLYYDSLEEYIYIVERSATGYSERSIDGPNTFLPCRTFFWDFEYIYGGYHYYEEAFLNPKASPERCILNLTYADDIYQKAKTYTLEQIPMHEQYVFEYNGYTFYKNYRYDEAKDDKFPLQFLMVGYNDDKTTLIFIGFYSNSDYSGNEDIEYMVFNDFGAFLCTYYGEYYNFDE